RTPRRATRRGGGGRRSGGARGRRRARRCPAAGRGAPRRTPARTPSAPRARRRGARRSPTACPGRAAGRRARRGRGARGTWGARRPRRRARRSSRTARTRRRRRGSASAAPRLRAEPRELERLGLHLEPPLRGAQLDDQLDVALLFDDLELVLHRLPRRGAVEPAFAFAAGDAQPRARARRVLLRERRDLLHLERARQPVAPLREQDRAPEAGDALAGSPARDEVAALAVRLLFADLRVLRLRHRMPPLDADRDVLREDERLGVGLRALLAERALALLDEVLQVAHAPLVGVGGLPVAGGEHVGDAVAHLVDLLAELHRVEQRQQLADALAPGGAPLGVLHQGRRDQRGRRVEDRGVGVAEHLVHAVREEDRLAALRLEVDAVVVVVLAVAVPVAEHQLHRDEGEERLPVDELVEARPAFLQIGLEARLAQRLQVGAVVGPLAALLLQIGVEILAEAAVVEVARRLLEEALHQQLVEA